MSSKLLDKLDLTNVEGLGCFRCRRSSNIQDNPPTILIIASPESDFNWKDSREAVVKIITQFRATYGCSWDFERQNSAYDGSNPDWIWRWAYLEWHSKTRGAQPSSYIPKVVLFLYIVLDLCPKLTWFSIQLGSLRYWIFVAPTIGSIV